MSQFADKGNDRFFDGEGIHGFQHEVLATITQWSGLRCFPFPHCRGWGNTTLFAPTVHQSLRGVLTLVYVHCVVLTDTHMY